MTAQPFRIALAGLGNVGAGVVELLERNRDLIEARAGRRIAIVAVSARDRARNRGVDLAPYRWVDDPISLAGASDVDAVVELIGGADGPALALAKATLAAKKPLVTANKAMIAHHGATLAARAEAEGVALRFEAAVAGGIPILKAIRHGLAANRIESVYGILNGTCNYILTKMEKEGRDFASVLEEAQRLGYAETDPSFDVDGIDTAHKLSILTALAFGCRIDFAGVATEGIRQVSPIDIDYARELGYRIKLLGIALRVEGAVEQRVHPCLVARDHPIAQVSGATNAVVAEGDFVGRTVFEGRGAGAGPTASAVVADLIDIVRGDLAPAFSVPAAALPELPKIDLDAHIGRYYLRLMVEDKPGVVADVASILRDEGVSMASLIQKDSDAADQVTLVLTTHETREKGVIRALEKFAKLPSVVASPVMMRIKAL